MQNKDYLKKVSFLITLCLETSGISAGSPLFKNAFDMAMSGVKLSNPRKTKEVHSITKTAINEVMGIKTAGRSTIWPQHDNPKKDPYKGKNNWLINDGEGNNQGLGEDLMTPGDVSGSMGGQRTRTGFPQDSLPQEEREPDKDMPYQDHWLGDLNRDDAQEGRLADHTDDQQFMADDSPLNRVNTQERDLKGLDGGSLEQKLQIRRSAKTLLSNSDDNKDIFSFVANYMQI